MGDISEHSLFQDKVTCLHSCSGSSKAILRLFEPSFVEADVGSITWKAGVVFAHHIFHRAPFFPYLRKDHKILELGCGTGVLGMSLAHEGYTVTFTDYSATLLKLVRQSLALSKLQGSTELLDWSNKLSDRPEFQNSFDVVVASDVLYEEEHSKLILEMIIELLKTSTPSYAIICNIVRHQPYFEKIQQDFTSRLENNARLQLIRDISLNILGDDFRYFIMSRVIMSSEDHE